MLTSPDKSKPSCVNWSSNADSAISCSSSREMLALARQKEMHCRSVVRTAL